MKRLLFLLSVIVLATSSWAQGVKPLPSLHVEGKWLVDQHGNHVVLHGVMDTPNAYFNGGRWGWDYSSVTPCINYFEKMFTGLEKAKCTIFRLHLDPVWTNNNSGGYVYEGSAGQPADATNEADISHFDPTRLTNYLKTLYFPLAKRAMNHGMFVVVRPPGVCPKNLQVGDYYNQYLLTVWDLVSKNDSIRKYAGQISIELANEPVNIRAADGSDSPKAMHDYFQPVVDKIRANGFSGIILVPGTGYQSNYRGYQDYPITGYNIGYAVHDYPGWYNSSDNNPGIANKRNNFHDAVPVVDTNPVVITEVDWSPYKEPREYETNADGSIKTNEFGQPVYKNLGTWATASTSKWGKAFKAMLDYFGNISMTLTHPHEFIDLDQLLKDGSVVPAFDGNPEACGKACMDWYADYYEVDWAHADFKNTIVSDQGTGKYRNPLISADFPDPDVVRAGDTYYMVSTTMHHFPGATILKSKDLVNWEYCAQPLAQLSASDRYSLIGGQNAYGSGMWACSMAWHDGRFYILLNGNDAGGFVLTATDPEGKWDMKPISRIYYDPGMLFDNGKIYVACGIGNIQMCELDEDFNYIREQNVIKDKDGLEGSHLYKIGDYYYIYATYGGWPSGQAIFRSKNIFGPYEEKMLIEKTISGKVNTVHQGALIYIGDGEPVSRDESTSIADTRWWTILQEDLGCLGRMPNLQPVRWTDDWPIVGSNGKPRDVFYNPRVGTCSPRTPLPTNDNFRSYPLGMQWQWNHNPDDGAWSLFERPGWLRLKASSTADRLTQARNMLTQRIFAFKDRPSTGTVRLDVSHLQECDRAGICILQDPYAFIAVEVKDGQRQLLWRQDQLTENSNFTPGEQRQTVSIDSVVYLRASVNYSTSKTQFYYSLDNKTYTPLGGETTLSFNLTVFVGARFGLFCYHHGQGTDNGGYADFDWFTTENTYEESMFYPADFEGFNEDMLTVEKLQLSEVPTEVMVGNSVQLQLTATYRDGHSVNVASQASYTVDEPGIVEISGGRIRGILEGTAHVHVSYRDPLGNELSDAFAVRSTFFPFAAQYINTSLFSQGTYNEQTRTFRPGQWGQMGWEYSSGADMSGYKYLVIKLKETSSQSHLNIYTAGSIWSPCCATDAFGSKKQIVVNLKTAKYTSDGDQKGQPLDTRNIRIVCFWGNGNQDIKVDDIYLTNNDDYSPGQTFVSDAVAGTVNPAPVVCDLQGRRLPAAAPLKPGLYIVNGRKVVVK